MATLGALRHPWHRLSHPYAEIRAGLEEAYELVAQASGIRFSFEAEDRQTHVNSFTFYLQYHGPLPTPNTVKVDITVSEILLFPVEQLPVLRTYPEFEDVPEDRPISVYSLNEIATEKIVALQDRARNEPRDLYGLWYLTSHAGIKIDRSYRGHHRETPLSGEVRYWCRRPDHCEGSSPEGVVERPSRASDGSVASV